MLTFLFPRHMVFKRSFNFIDRPTLDTSCTTVDADICVNIYPQVLGCTKERSIEAAS